jgi:murein DD-endopeptidase MepM/ murein hydrolase activator NlpD
MQTGILATIVTVLLVGIGAGSYALHEMQKDPTETVLFEWPLPEADERKRLLTFGLYVTPEPESNPITPPERFTGYHSGLDFEILPNEEDSEVPVYAACDGPVAYKNWTEGYGGLLVQHCTVGKEPVTVLYGHLALDSIRSQEGEELRRGDTIGFLGAAKSEETDQTRKHLHFGIHQGEDIDLKGYVQEQAELEQYIDPAELLAL